MTDRTFQTWLERQYVDGIALTEKSPAVRLQPARGSPPVEYFAEFECRTLVNLGESVQETTGFAVYLRFAEDYLRRIPDPSFVIGLLRPGSIFHPNVRFGCICLGRLAPGTPLVDVLYQAHESLTWQRFALDNPLDPDASAWASRNLKRFPIHNRPLSWQ